MPQFDRYLFVCANRRPDGSPRGSCAGRGALEVHALLKEQLAALPGTEVRTRACTASCLGVCWAGPVIAVEPEGYFYGRVTPADVPELVAAIANGTRVERLVLPATDFDEATAGPPLRAAGR